MSRKQPPPWLELLWELRIESGGPTFDAMAESTRISKSQLHKIISGTITPDEADLKTIVYYLGASKHQTAAIMDAYNSRTARRQRAKAEPDNNTADAIRQLATAIDNLADAIWGTR